MIGKFAIFSGDSLSVNSYFLMKSGLFSMESARLPKAIRKSNKLVTF